MSLVNVRNCIRFYQTAEELGAGTLMNYCAEIIASHWVSARWRAVSTAHAWQAGDLGSGLLLEMFLSASCLRKMTREILLGSYVS